MKRCPVCDTKDKWTNVDNLRVKKVGMIMCDECGFITYEHAFKSAEEMKEYYRKSYRAAPQASNLFTGERKLQYHSVFLEALFTEWKNAGITKPVIGEIGSATGMFLNWVKQHFPEAEVHGTELTETFRRVAYHEYGLKLAEEFDTTKKYDLIVSYHVLEHQPDPDLRLAEYTACLKDHGVFYLSCPVWFREAHNGATGGFDIEYLMHPDHINAWSEQHLEYIIAKANVEPIMKNDNVYGNTYILRKTATNYVKPKFDRDAHYAIAKNIYDCWVLMQEGKHEEALKVFPDCVAAWVNLYEWNRAKLHKDPKALDDLFKKATESCKYTGDVFTFAADVYTRYERYEEAIEFFKKGLGRKPNNPTLLMGIANCYHMMARKEKDDKKKSELLQKSLNTYRFVMNISTELLPQALSWAYQVQSSLAVPL